MRHTAIIIATIAFGLMACSKKSSDTKQKTPNERRIDGIVVKIIPTERSTCPVCGHAYHQVTSLIIHVKAAKKTYVIDVKEDGKASLKSLLSILREGKQVNFPLTLIYKNPALTVNVFDKNLHGTLAAGQFWINTSS